MQRRPGTGAPCSALDPVGAGRVDRPDWERSSRPSTCPCCPARTRSYPPRISCRSRTPAVRLRSAPKAASARDGRRRTCACSTRRRFRFANIQWRARPSGGSAAVVAGGIAAGSSARASRERQSPRTNAASHGVRAIGRPPFRRKRIGGERDSILRRHPSSRNCRPAAKSGAVARITQPTRPG